MVKRETNPDVFARLISSIISQQVSTKSANTVKNRLIDLIGKITPENLNKLEKEEIQKCGMSMRKAGYIKKIAEKSVSGDIDFENLYKLSDEEISKELMSLKGVGEWTADMLLIHAFERPDILSFKDLGIRRGIEKLYGIKELSKEKFNQLRERYSPYGSVASLYIWEISEGK